MKDTSWDHALEVTAGGSGLVGHAGGILLRKLADQCGLTAALDGALTLKGRFPQLSRGMVLISTAIAIAMGATAMADIAVLASSPRSWGRHVRLDRPPGPGPGHRPDAGPDRAGQGTDPRARLGADRGRGRVTLAGRGREGPGRVAGHRHGRHPGHRALGQTGSICHLEDGLGLPPLGAWAANTRECLAMLLRTGSAGSNTFTDHKEVLAAALKQVPAAFRRRSWSASTAPGPATSSSSTCSP